jgi:hypothetical protein
MKKIHTIVFDVPSGNNKRVFEIGSEWKTINQITIFFSQVKYKVCLTDLKIFGFNVLEKGGISPSGSEDLLVNKLNINEMNISKVPSDIEFSFYSISQYPIVFRCDIIGEMEEE